MINELEKENALLLKQVEAVKQSLVEIEMKNGKVQVPLPNAVPLIDGDTMRVNIVEQAGKMIPDTNTTTVPSNKSNKEKKPKKEKPAADDLTKKAIPVAVEEIIDVGRLDMRVGKIVEVSKHPDADSLYLEKIDCGEAKPRTVISGLVKFIPIEEMQNRMVVILCNLKPAKMRGILSEAMVMCASSPGKVEILSPPTNAVCGDLVHCEGYTRNPDAQMNPKKKIFETVAPDLMTNDTLVACYKGSPLIVPGKGPLLSQTLKNVIVK